MFFNYWIGFLNENYLFLAVCTCLNLHHFKWSTFGDGFNSTLAITLGLLVILFPLFVGIFYNKTSNFQLIMKQDQHFLG